MPFDPAGVLQRVTGTRIPFQGPLVSAQINDEIDDLITAINAKPPSPVVSRGTMATIDVAKFTLVYLNEGRRSGHFRWQTFSEGGDFTARIASDPSQGIYVQHATVLPTIGCWVRDGNIRDRSPYWWNAPIDGTSGSTAWQAMLNVIDAAGDGVTVKLGRETHYLNTQVTLAATNGGSISLVGIGKFHSRIVVMNATGGIKFTSAFVNWSCFVSDVSIEPGMAGAGNLLAIEGTAGGAPRKNVVILDDIALGPNNHATTFESLQPLKCTGVGRPILNNVWQFQGAFATGRATRIVDFTDCYQPWVMASRFNSKGDYAIYLNNTVATEGFLFLNSTIVETNYGIFIQRVTDREPHCEITGSHINCYIKNIHIDGAKHVNISNNVLYALPPVDGTYTQSGTTTVTVTQPVPHRMLIGASISITTSGGGSLPSGVYTVTATPSASIYEFTAAGSATTSGVVTYDYADVPFSDTALLNVEQADIINNQYHNHYARLRRHVEIDSTNSVFPGAKIIRNIRISEGGLGATSIISPYYVGANADKVQIRWGTPSVTDHASYIAALTEIAAGATDVDARPLNSILAYSTSNDVNSGGAETDLKSVTVPSWTFKGTNRIIRFKAWGTAANNANAKTVKAYLGGDLLTTFSLTISVVGRWQGETTITSFGLNSQRSNSVFLDNSGQRIDSLTTSQTDTAPIVFKVTGTGVASSDITCQGLIAEYL